MITVCGSSVAAAATKASFGLPPRRPQLHSVRLPSLKSAVPEGHGVHDLISTDSFTTDSPEFLAMAEEVQSLNKHEARELRDLLGGRTEVPGTDDEVKATFAKALLMVTGFTVERKLLRSKEKKT